MPRTKTTLRIGPPMPVIGEANNGDGGSGSGGGMAEAWISRIPRETRMLLPFVVLTLVAHIAVFYCVEITYPVAQREIPARTELMMLNESTLSERERAALEFWTEMNDPGRMIVPTGPVLTRADLAIKWNPRGDFPSAPSAESGLGGLGGETSVADFLASVPRSGGEGAVAAETTGPGSRDTRQAPANAARGPRMARDLRQNSALSNPSMMPLFGEGWPSLQERVSQGMSPPRQEFIYPTPVSATAASTKSFAVFDADGTARLIPGTLPALPNPPYDALAALGSTVLSLGVDGSGRVRHAIVAESCGRPSIDQLALTAIRRAQFQPAGSTSVTATDSTSEITWLQCTVYWRFSAAPRDDKAPGNSSKATLPAGKQSRDNTGS